MQKWNYEKQEYESYNIPDDWFCPMFCNIMEELINCPNCGTRFEFGNGYTSLVIHGKSGMGYTVCPTCHEKEILTEKLYRK